MIVTLAGLEALARTADGIRGRPAFRLAQGHTASSVQNAPPDERRTIADQYSNVASVLNGWRSATPDPADPRAGAFAPTLDASVQPIAAVEGVVSAARGITLRTGTVAVAQSAEVGYTVAGYQAGFVGATRGVVQGAGEAASDFLGSGLGIKVAIVGALVLGAVVFAAAFARRVVG